MEAYVWALDEKRKVLVTDDPGPPLGGRLIGSYPLPDGGGWGEAQKVAEQVAAHDPNKQYEIVYDAPLTGPADDIHDDTCDCEECCGDDVEYESDDEEEGCLFPDECMMPGRHLNSECHKAEMLEEQGRQESPEL
jgi:hypothetical protein